MRKILSFTAVILILSSIFCLFAACDSSEDTLVMATNAGLSLRMNINLTAGSLRALTLKSLRYCRETRDDSSN